MLLYGFKTFLENTIAQELRKLPQDKAIAEIRDKMKKELVAASPTFFNGPGKNRLDLVANFLTYTGIKDRLYHDDSSLMIATSVGYWRANFADYVIANANNNAAMSKLNSPQYTRRNLIDDAHQWHEDLKKKPNGLQGATDGKTILEFPDGFRWVLLPRGYCSVEGKAMGHCGNVNARPDDEILSLRDKKNVPHLTFVINNGEIGESKGRGNDKPAPRYHKYIVDLFTADLEDKEISIDYVAGGGYKPENNFKMEDLSPQDLEKIKKENFWLGKPGYYLLQMGSFDEINEKIKYKFLRFAATDYRTKTALLTYSPNLLRYHFTSWSVFVKFFPEFKNLIDVHGIMNKNGFNAMLNMLERVFSQSNSNKLFEIADNNLVVNLRKMGIYQTECDLSRDKYWNKHINSVAIGSQCFKVNYTDADKILNLDTSVFNPEEIKERLLDIAKEYV